MMVLSYLFITYHKKKVIFDTRGLFFEELFDSGKLPRNKLLCSIFSFIERKLLQTSSVTFCVTELHRNYYQRLSLNTNYRVIYNGAKKEPAIATSINKDKITFCYVGSLVKWHLPERIAHILFLLQSSGLDFDFHCITKDLDTARSIFGKIKNNNIYTHNFRDKPIKFDYGFCLISDTLSKRVCFPVKYAEYLMSGTKVIFSSNVDVCNKLNDKYPSGLAIDLNLEDCVIASKIVDFIDSEYSDSIGTVSLPYELEFDSMMDNIKVAIDEIVIKP
jgi:glycosyltransferase involved in cell wall biosynthesis